MLAESRVSAIAIAGILCTFAATCGPLFGETVILQEGNSGYTGCVTATLWGPGTSQPANPSDQYLYMRGAKNRLLIRFEIPEDLRGRQLVRARLEVFLPSVRKLRMICEIMCREVLEAWTADADWRYRAPEQRWQQYGGTFDLTTDYNRGRPAGAVDSYSLWEYDGRYFRHKYAFLGVPPEGKWIDFNITPLVRKWLDDPDTNFGVALVPVNLPDTRFPNTAEIDIPSEAFSNPALRPRLILEFEPVEKPYLVSMTHTLRKFCDRSTRYRFFGPFEEHYEMAMARNEYEGFQVLVYPLTEPLRGVTFEWSDLTDPDTGATIPKEDITYYVEEVFTLHRNGKINDWYFHGKNFDVPDPLTTARPVDLPLHMSTPFWFTVRTRPDTPPGTYRGTITVKPQNAPPRQLSLTVKVWNYKIPEKWNFQTMGQMVWGYVSKVYGGISQSLRMKFIDFLLEHRFNPTEQYIDVISPQVQYIPYCLERGANTIYLSGNYTGNINALKQRYDYIKRLGLIDMALVYIGDETNNWDLMRQRSRTIRLNCPELMIMIGGSKPRPELDRVIDIYDPQVGGNSHYCLNENETHLIAESQAKGEKFFWYVAAGPMLPYMNVQMEEPLIAARVFFWLTWKYRVTGFEYYCYNIWAHNLPQDGKRWPDIPFSPQGWGDTNGDGMLFYPGPDGPFSSVRFENIRDGVEDWESHYVLRDYVDALKKKIAGDPALANEVAQLLDRAEEILDVPAEVCSGFTEWTWQPEVLLQARNELGETIEALTRYVTEEEMLAIRQARKRAELHRQRRMLWMRYKEAAGLPSWDTNGDGHCDTLDLLNVAAAFGTQLSDEQFEPKADVNVDDRIDLLDILELVNHFGM